MMWVEENNEEFLVRQKDQGGAQQKFQEISSKIQRQSNDKALENIPRGSKKLSSRCSGAAIATLCQPHGYGPDREGFWEGVT